MTSRRLDTVAGTVGLFAPLADRHRAMLLRLQPFSGDPHVSPLGWINRIARSDRHRHLKTDASVDQSGRAVFYFQRHRIELVMEQALVTIGEDPVGFRTARRRRCASGALGVDALLRTSPPPVLRRRQTDE